MILLTGSAQKLTAVMNAAATSTQPLYYVSYVDMNGTYLVQGNYASGSLNGTTPVNMVTGTTDQFKIAQVDIFNSDTVVQTITVSVLVSATTQKLYQATLLSN
jgi:hypothetical protein